MRRIILLSALLMIALALAVSTTMAAAPVQAQIIIHIANGTQPANMTVLESNETAMTPAAKR